MEQIKYLGQLYHIKFWKQFLIEHEEDINFIKQFIEQWGNVVCHTMNIWNVYYFYVSNVLAVKISIITWRSKWADTEQIMIN